MFSIYLKSAIKIKTSRNKILKYFYNCFSKKIILDIFCESSPIHRYNKSLKKKKIHISQQKTAIWAQLFKTNDVSDIGKYAGIFCWKKMWVAFAVQKLLTFFQQKISEYYCILNLLKQLNDP